MLIVNIVFINIIALVLLSIYWSNWSFIVFKPHKWIKLKNNKTLNDEIKKLERKTKDKVLFFSIWEILERIKYKNVEGCACMYGLELNEILRLITYSLSNSNKNIYLFDNLVDKTIELKEYECNSVEHNKTIPIKKIPVEQIKQLSDSNTLINIENYSFNINEPISFAFIDVVEDDLLINTLSKVYGQLSKGGVMVIHDYNHIWDNVKYILDKFENSVSENFIPIADMYGSVVLIKS